MKKLFMGFLLVLAMAASAHAAAPAGAIKAFDPVAVLTGQHWLDSSLDNKKAYLFGIETAIAIESDIANQKSEAAKKSGRPSVEPSLFVRAWIGAFTGTTNDEIVDLLDDWFKAHPEDANRPVMDVIWYQLIVPRMDAKNR